MKKIISCILILLWTTIYWDVVQNTDLSHYSVERKTTMGSWREVAQTNKGIEQARVSGSRNRTYSYRITAVDNSGNVGNPSNTLIHKFE